MPLENWEDEGLARIPNLEIAQWRFLLNTDKHKGSLKVKNDIIESIKRENGPSSERNWRRTARSINWENGRPNVDSESILTKITSKCDVYLQCANHNMAPMYEQVFEEFGWPQDAALLQQMKATNEAKIKELDGKIDDAEKNLGETEVRDFMLEKALFLTKIGAKDEALSQFRKTGEKTVTVGFRLDMVFHQLRIGLFHMDHDLIKRNLEKAQSLIDEGGDWDRRNRLKVYKGLYCMAIRDFKSAANLFLDTVATFTSYELMDYTSFVTYTVFSSMIALDRPDLRLKVIKGSEILEVLHSSQDIRQFLFSMYDCHYGDFFKCLAEVEDKMKYDRYLAPHVRYYVREMRIQAYSQLLESYQSLTLQYMADAFRVSQDFIDRELSRFIAAGRLHAKIDKVGGIVETNRPDSKNYQYQETIKKGDILLNRIQKLSRVINI